jgi:hypothetical protein
MRRAPIRAANAAMVIGSRGGTCSVTQPSSVACRGDAGSDRKLRRIVGWQLVEDGEPRLDGRAVLGVDRAVDAAVKTTRPRSCSRMKASRQAGLSGREAGAGDGDQPAALGEARERRGDVAQAASAMRPSTLAIAENGGFISTTLGTAPRRDDRRSARRRSG